MNPGLAHIVKASGIAVLLGLLTSMPAAAAPIVVKGGGTFDPASIQSFVDILWTDLGNPNNGNTPGPLLSGWREIDRDGGGPPVEWRGPRILL